MNPSQCPRPLEPIDAEALAAGSEPVFAADAVEHARLCETCGLAVATAASLSEGLDALREAEPGPAPGFGERIVRLRAFSPAERRSFSLWRGPLFFAGALFFAGLLFLALPGITAREQAGLAVAALAPLTAFLRALARSLVELGQMAPVGTEALSDALRREQNLGFVALLLLAPLAFGLKRALSRARR